MSLLRRAVWMAAKRAASDPRLQARATEFARDEIAPRARRAADQAGPVVERTAERAGQMAAGVRKAASEHSPLADPQAFLRAAKDRLKDKS